MNTCNEITITHKIMYGYLINRSHVKLLIDLGRPFLLMTGPSFPKYTMNTAIVYIGFCYLKKKEKKSCSLV